MTTWILSEPSLSWLRKLAFCIFALIANTHQAFADRCAPPIGWSELEPKSSSHIIMLGEVHGTEEVPRFSESLLCNLVRMDKPVKIGIEASRAQSDGLNALIRAGSDFSDEEAYAAAPRMWQSHDGRSSVAMLNLLRRFAGWYEFGADIEVFAFDADPEEYDTDRNRSRHATMAAMVDEAAYIITME